MQNFEIDPTEPFFIAGANGMVGSAVKRVLVKRGHTKILSPNSKMLDLADRKAVFEFFRREKPTYVVLAAAKVGGILANNSFPYEFISENLQIQTNVMDAALAENVSRLLFMGSSCIYPKFAQQPINEEQLLTGALEPTNSAYAVAKIAGLEQVRSARRQYGMNWISIMPTNLYGRGDSYTESNSHVIPSLIRRYSHAVKNGHSEIINWGTGSPKREFLNVDDLADATLFLLGNYNGDLHINVGSGEEHSIKETAQIIADNVGFQGETLWDVSKPDGTPRKLLDSAKLESLGWKPTINFPMGINDAIQDFKNRFTNV